MRWNSDESGWPCNDDKSLLIRAGSIEQAAEIANSLISKSIVHNQPQYKHQCIFEVGDDLGDEK